MVALKLNKLIIPMCSITLLIISWVSLIEFSNTANLISASARNICMSVSRRLPPRISNRISRNTC